MQEETEIPGLGGNETLASLKALEGLVELARARGAAPLLMLTFGWLDGYNPHRDVYPTYTAMQARPQMPVSSSHGPSDRGWC